MKPTPTPWTVQYGTNIAGPEHAQVATTWQEGMQHRPECVANAEHIVRCVNTHDVLVAALHAVISKVGPILKSHGYVSVVAMEKARKAIAKATAA